MDRPSRPTRLCRRVPPVPSARPVRTVVCPTRASRRVPSVRPSRPARGETNTDTSGWGLRLSQPVRVYI